MSMKFKRTGISVACVGLMALAGCGGGGGGGGGGGLFIPPVANVPPSSGESTPLDPVTVTGVLTAIGTVSNAVVCVDRNNNDACDEGEPVSAKTGADGVYTFSYTPANAAAAAELAAAPLVAQLSPASIVGGAIVSDGASFDSANALTPITFSELNLSAPAAKRGHVNPLTTLVQVGVSSGLALDHAEVAVGLQLGIPAADIYSYQGQNATFGIFGDNAQTMAMVTLFAIGNGAALKVIDPAAANTATPTDQLPTLTFAGVNDYSVKTYPSDGVIDPATGTQTLTDVRYGKAGGAAIAENVLYNRAILGPTGWVRCNASSAFTSTVGVPSRSSYCAGGSQAVGYSMPTDISGQTMESVTAEIQGGPGSSISGINPAIAFPPGSVFPAGSVRTFRNNLDLVQSYFINSTSPGSSDKTAFAQLEFLQNARQASAVNLAAGTGTAGLGLYDNTHLLRFAFMNTAGNGDGVQYYSCVSTPPAYLDVGACTLLGTGTATINTIHGARVLELSNQPNVTSPQTRAYTEYDDGGGTRVWQVRRVKSDLGNNLSQSNRLNGPAYKALLDALGVVPPI